MTNHISRRNLAKGSAWALPAVALASAAPAATTSPSVPPKGCYLTDADLNAGVSSPASISIAGAKTYSTTGGNLLNATTLSDIALVSTCNYKGSVSAYWTANFGLGNQVPAATMTFTNGTTYTGRTGGTISSGGALAGFAATNSVTWTGSAKSNRVPSNWVGAVVTVPFVWYYTAPNGSLQSVHYALQYTMGGPYSVVGQNMINPTIIAV